MKTTTHSLHHTVRPAEESQYLVHPLRAALGFVAVALLLLLPLRSASTETESQALDLDPREPIGLNTEQEALWELTLDHARRLGLQNSLTLKRSELSPRIQAASKTVAEAQFDWILSADTRYTRGKDRSFGERNHTQSWDNTLSIVRSFPTGTHVSSSLFYDKFERELTTGGQGVSDRAGLSIRVEQNLLRGLGLGPNLFSIELAELGLQLEESRFSQQKLELLFAIDQAYWNLVFAHEDLGVTANSFALAREDLAITRSRRASGFATEIEVIAAEVRLAQKEQEMIERQRFVRDRSDELLELIAPQRLIELLQDAQRQIIVPIGYDTSVPPAAHDLDVREALSEALTSREELHQAGLQVDMAELTARQREHELRPELNAVAGFTFGGAGTNTGDAFESWGRTDTVNWFLGLEFNVPLNNRAARGRHEEAQLQRRQSDLDEQLTLVQVITDVLAAIREIRTTRQALETAVVAERLAERQVEARTKMLAVGTATRFELDSDREDLDIARRNRRQAEVTLRIALSRLELAKGTIGQER